VSLDTFVETIEQSLRLALWKAIAQPPYRNDQMADWDLLVLGKRFAEDGASNIPPPEGS